MTWLGWTNTFLPFIVPAIGNAFGTFWMRQYIASAIPSELFDAARLDGCGEFAVFWRIALPLAAPAAGALAITTFIGGWNSFLGPLIVMTDPDMYTYAVALADPARGARHRRRRAAGRQLDRDHPDAADHHLRRPAPDRRPDSRRLSGQ